MNGDEVFERTAQKYADCRTYSDSGRVESNLGVMTFKTTFVRPNLFKFEFSHETEEQGKSGIIWSDGNEFFTSYNHELDHVPCDNISSLFVEIGLAAQPVSYLVPMILLPDYADAHALANGAPYTTAEHTSIADRSCHRIKSSPAPYASNPGSTYVADLLIDSLGYKLRRMIVDYGEDLKAQVIFTDVSFDREISEDVFNLKHR